MAGGLNERCHSIGTAGRVGDAIILPHAYGENQKEIVRLETQYQIGEDAKVEYGPLQKYLHARRLNRDLGIPEKEIDVLMGQPKGYTEKLLATMDLMDEYLEYIGCPRLYTMLKDDAGTKEGMFVDLNGDLNRLLGGNSKVEWAFDPVVDVLELKTIHFDYIRLGEHSDAGKSYREISHQSKGKNFFGYRDIWEPFRQKHQTNISPITIEMGSLEEFIQQNPGYESKVDAARARDEQWADRVDAPMKENFGKSSSQLFYRVSELAPREYLERAKLALEKVDVEAPGFLADPENRRLVHDINNQTYEMKKRFDRKT